MTSTPSASEADSGDRATPRLLAWLVQAFLAVVALNALQVTIADGVGAGPLREAPTAVLATAASVLTLAVWAAFAHTVRRAITDQPAADHSAPRRLVLLAALALLPVPVLGPEWLTWTAFLGFAVVWLVPGPVGRVLFVVVLATVAPLWRFVTGGFDGITFELLSYVATSLLLYGLVFTARVAAELERTRTQLAGSRVLEERLRMSRDLHEVIGGNVVALSLKSELALRHVRNGDPEQASEEVAQVLSLTHATGADLRSLVSGFRRPSFAAEIAAGRRLLEDAGVRCTVEHPDDLPAHAQQDAARAVREAVAEVLQRSDVSAVRLVITLLDDRPVLTLTHTLTHEGADAPSRAPSGGVAP
jgi:two-component system, NarL family, sensor histidine kinase DesK